MRKRILLSVFAIVLPLLSAWGQAWDGTVATSFAGGSGTEDDPYQISNGAELAYLAQQVNNGSLFAGKYVKLTADIDLNGSENNQWDPIGLRGWDNNWNMREYAFQGTFDGDGHSVKNVYIDKPEGNRIGLFGWLSNGAVVKNLGVENAYVRGQESVGSICGYLQWAGIENCYATGQVLLVKGEVSGNAGGICGGTYGYANTYSNNGKTYIKNCYNLCEVTAEAGNVGGIVGSNYCSTISNCYNAGTIKGTSHVGGITGNEYFIAYIKDCYNSGNVNGSTYVGGISGTKDGTRTDYPSYITNCYYDKSICGNIGGFDGVDEAGMAEGKTTEELISGSLFNHAETWEETSGLYPRLTGMDGTDAAKLSAVPIFLTENDHLSMLQNNFRVSTEFGTTWTAQNGLVTVSSGNVTVGGTSGIELLTANLNGIQRNIQILVNKTFTSAGTEDAPYLITSKTDLEALATMVNAGCSYEGKYFLQTTDIALGGTEASQWIPIGNAAASFKGTYNGGNHTTSGLYIKNTESYQALFGYATGSNTIEKLNVKGSVEGDKYVSLLCAYNAGGTISDCTATGTVTANSAGGNGSMEDFKGFAAGICAYIDHGTISNCTNMTDVNALQRDEYNIAQYVGGIAGLTNYSTISQCSNSGNVSNASGWYVGGIIGQSNSTPITQCLNSGIITGSYCTGGIAGEQSQGDLTNSYNFGEIVGTDTYRNTLGGICGNLYGVYSYGTDYPASIINCFNAGKLTVPEGTRQVGNITGGYTKSSASITIKNCYYDSSLNGETLALGADNQIGTDDTSNLVVGKSMEELKDGSTLFASAEAGIWKYRNGSYPQLTIFAVEDDDVVKKEVNVTDSEIASSATVALKVVSTEDKTVAVNNLDEDTSASIDGTIEIPGSVSIGGESYAVTTISANAFTGATNLEGVVIPASVSAIGANAFSGCSSLATVTLEGATAPEIGTNAFYGTALTGIEFPAAAYEDFSTALGTSGISTDLYKPTVTMKQGDWATIYSTQTYDLTDESGLEAYIVVGMDYDERKVLLQAKSGIQANVPMLLHKAGTADSYTVKIPSDLSFRVVEEGEPNAIYKGGTTEQTLTSTTENQCYILYDNAFVRAANGKLAAYKCYLQLNPTQFATAGSRSLGISIVDNETVTTINEVETLTNGKTTWHTLDGRQISDAPAARGIYIVNGKKVVK